MLPARRQVIVHHVEGLAVNPFNEPRQDDCICAVINIRKGYRVRAAQMQERTECTNPDPARNTVLAIAINAAWSDYHVWNSALFSVLGDDFLLFDLSKAISLSAEFGMLINRTRFV